VERSLPFYFKILFIAGATILFVSFCVDWYTFQMFENGILTVSWSYNIFFEWSTELPLGITENESFRPENLEIPPLLNFLFIGVLAFTLYTIFFKDLEQVRDVAPLRKFSFGFMCLIALLLFYIVIFPLVYLIPHELYFPSLIDNDLDLGIKFAYEISFGYVLQLIGFLLVFPYSLHYYLTITQFERQENTPEKRIVTYINNVQEHIDLDKYIAEEEALL
jgi:hypothetical protein